MLCESILPGPRLFPLRGTSEFMRLALTGQVPGVTRIVFGGFNNDIDTATIPEDVWGGDGLIPRPAANESWEIVGGVNDTATGTGARTVGLTTVDNSYVSTPQTVTMNGATAVPLTGQHRFINIGSVLTAGSLGKPSQPLIIRVAGGGPIRAYIGTEGFLNQAKFTVPANFRLELMSTTLGLRTDGVTTQSLVFNNITTNSAGRELAPLRIPLITNGVGTYKHEVSNGLVPYNTIQATNEVTHRIVADTANNTQIDITTLALLYDGAIWPN